MLYEPFIDLTKLHTKETKVLNFLNRFALLYWLTVPFYAMWFFLFSGQSRERVWVYWEGHKCLLEVYV